MNEPEPVSRGVLAWVVLAVAAFVGLVAFVVTR